MSSCRESNGSLVPSQDEVLSGTPYEMLSLPVGASGVSFRQQSDARLKKSDLTASIVADLFINLCNNHGDTITNLKLQKLVYYSQAWYLALNNQPLFHDRIEAWDRGPTQPDVFAKFSSFAHRPIDCTPVEWQVSPKIKKHIEEVMSAYGHLSSFDLEQVACSEEPWRASIKKTPPEISTTLMKNFYKLRLDG